MAKKPKKDDRNIEELVDVLDRVAFQLNGCQQIFNTLFNNDMEDEEYKIHLAKFQPSLVVCNSYLIVSIQMLNEILLHYQGFGVRDVALIEKCNEFEVWAEDVAKPMRNNFAAHPFQEVFQYVLKHGRTTRILERKLAISRGVVNEKIEQFFKGDMTYAIKFYNDDCKYSLQWIQSLILELKQNWTVSRPVL